MAEDVGRVEELERSDVGGQNMKSSDERQDQSSLEKERRYYPNKHDGGEPSLETLPGPTAAEKLFGMAPLGPVETPKAKSSNPKPTLSQDIIEEGHQATQEGESSTDGPLRVSSSAFLPSLGSASEIFSPMASGYPSSTSLQSSRASKDSVEESSLPSLRDKAWQHHDVSASGGDSAPMIESHSSSSTSTEAPALHPNNNQTYFNHLVSQQASASSVSVPLHTSSRTSNAGQNTHASVSPSRSQRHLPAVSTTKSADHTPSERSPDPFLGLSVRRIEEGGEEGYTRTPLLQATDFPEPKETHKLIKDSDSMGNKRINDYEVLRRLGSGAHGTVKLGRNLHSRQHVAIKIVRRYPKKGRLGKQETPEDKVKKEVAVLKKARHPHVVSLLEVIDDHEYGKVYLILEYVERGEVIWRKQTDREISIFEMNRVRRELAGPVDDEHEMELLAQLNERLRTKHLENEMEGIGFHQSPALDENIEPMELTAQQTVVGPARDLYQGVRDYEGRSRASSDVENKPVDNNTPSPVQTVREPSHHSMHDPHNASEHGLGGSMYGSFIEDETWTQASDIEHTFSFSNELSEWTDEEEEFRFVPCLTLSEARDIFRDTVLGLEFLHFHNIFHRDIKPANLLWTSNYRVKISDFGVSYLGRPIRDEDEADGSDLSHLDEDVELAKTVGTPAFYAPELCDPDLFDPRKNSSRPPITAQIDVWALGVTLYAMIFGRLPFYDSNEFAMYEKIARHEVFISSKRLRGVDDEHQIPVNSNKREDHIVEYEDVDETLKDLLKRLLDKNPSKRITLREVKHHPWVLEDVSDKVAWIDSTDPSLKDTFVSKIEVSQRDLQEAVAPLNIMDRFKSGIRRFASVVRGRDRDSRKRAESSTPQAASVSASSRAASTQDRESRRSSLRGDEVISAIRASREKDEHPLSQSTLASPTAEEHPTEFVTPISYVEPSHSNLSSPSTAQRPAPASKSAGTTESVMTIKGHVPFLSTSSNEYSAAEDAHRSAATESGGSSSSISRLITNTGLRLANRVRSRGPGKSSRENSNFSSRASSADNLSSNVEDGHVPASVALSPATALGHVNAPPLTRDVTSRSTNTSPQLARQSSAESLQRPSPQQENHPAENAGRRRGGNTNWTPSSVEAESFSTQHGSLPDHLTGVFSSDEQLSSEANEPFSATQSAPSVGSRASSPPTSFAGVNGGSHSRGGGGGGFSRPSEEELDRRRSSLMATGETITPAIMQRYQAQSSHSHGATTEHDETGYSADGDDGDDGDSDDEGVMMSGGERKKRAA